MNESDLTECPYCGGPIVWYENKDMANAGPDGKIRPEPRCENSCEDTKAPGSVIAPMYF